MNEQPPVQEFGKRRPAAVTPPGPQKRSTHVALLVMGTLAVGSTAYAVMPRNNCEPPSPGMAAPLAQDNTACTSRGSSGSGGHSSRYSYFSGDSSSRSSAATSSDSGTSHVTRGGFGGFAHAFGFSGHG